LRELNKIIFPAKPDKEESDCVFIKIKKDVNLAKQYKAEISEYKIW